MYCQNNSSAKYSETCLNVSTVTAVVIVALGIVTAFVIGILGFINGTLGIPPVGCQAMVGLSGFCLASFVSCITR